MLISFRHGLVNALPSFVEPKASSVNLIVGDDPLVLTISSGTTNYLWNEKKSVVNAWGPISVGQDVWLYWDIDARTAQRTFGTTIYAPVVSSTQPVSPRSNQHWYDSNAKQMKVWTGAAWQAKNRVFACMLANGSTPISMSANAPAFTGTQVGDSSHIMAGYILFDASDLPLKTNTGKFLTTEDTMRTTLTSTADVKLSTLVVEAKAVQNLARYTIVKFSDFGEIIAATTRAANIGSQYGIIERDVTVGELVHVATSGVITNLDWDWTSIGVNAFLYCDDNGVIVPSPVIPQQAPIAFVVNRHSIQLGSITLTQNQIITTTNNYDNGPATTTDAGIVKLNIPPALDVDPIAVGANDPRLSDARVPLSHTHTTGNITDLQQVLSAYLPLQGGTLTGVLTLSADPLQDTSAATKHYVDVQGAALTSSLNTLSGAVNSLGTSLTSSISTKVDKGGDVMSGLLVLSDDPATDLGAATKRYVDTLRTTVQGITLSSLAGGSGSNTQVLRSNGNGTYAWQNQAPLMFQLACSDLTTAITTGNNKGYFRSPVPFTLTSVRASLLTASSSGSVVVTITANGVSILSASLTITASSKSATTTSLQNVSIPDDAEILINVTSQGTGAKGLVVTLIGNPA